MFTRKQMTASADVCFKSNHSKGLSEEAAKQGELRRLRQTPIQDEKALRELCLYLLLDKDDIAVIDFDKKGRVEHITAVPLCFRHALEDYHYLRAVIEEREHQNSWAVAIHLREKDEETLESTLDIVDRCRNLPRSKGAFFVLCCGFETILPWEREDSKFLGKAPWNVLQTLLSKYYQTNNNKSEDSVWQKKRKQERSSP